MANPKKIVANTDTRDLSGVVDLLRAMKAKRLVGSDARAALAAKVGDPIAPETVAKLFAEAGFAHVAGDKSSVPAVTFDMVRVVMLNGAAGIAALDNIAQEATKANPKLNPKGYKRLAVNIGKARADDPKLTLQEATRDAVKAALENGVEPTERAMDRLETLTDAILAECAGKVGLDKAKHAQFMAHLQGLQGFLPA